MLTFIGIYDIIILLKIKLEDGMERGRIGYYTFEKIVDEMTLIKWLGLSRKVNLWCRLEDAQRQGLIRDLHNCQGDKQC